MTALELINALGTGSPALLLAFGIWAFVTGRIMPRSTHVEAMAAKDAELARAQEREAGLWAMLKTTAGWIDQSAGVTERATRLVDVQTPPPTWTGTEAQIARRPPRSPKTPR